jgi:hypothetical protein
MILDSIDQSARLTMNKSEVKKLSYQDMLFNLRMSTIENKSNRNSGESLMTFKS